MLYGKRAGHNETGNIMNTAINIADIATMTDAELINTEMNARFRAVNHPHRSTHLIAVRDACRTEIARRTNV